MKIVNTMQVSNCIFHLSLMLLLMLTGCSKQASNNSGLDPINSSDQGEEETRMSALKNYVSNLDLKGYVGTNLKNNVNYWQKTA